MASGADSSRATIETLVMFDESEGAHNVGDVYQDGSAAWTDGPMVMPEQVAYQPAGKNTKAFDDDQWYRLEPCAGASAIEKVCWCTDSASTGYDSSDGTYTAGTCDISAKGQGIYFHQPSFIGC